jgi:hypothetical protein
MKGKYRGIFGLNIFHLILTKINCITLNIRSKADENIKHFSHGTCSRVASH